MGMLYIYILSEHLFLKIFNAYKFKRLMKENEKIMVVQVGGSLSKLYKN